MNFYKKLNCFAIVKLLLFSLVFIASSCMSYEQSIIKLSEEANKNTNVKQFIIDDLKTKKIIFLSELHDEIDPVLFLAENLQSFYDNGIRYLLLESGLKKVPGDSDYKFICMYPWMSAGLKYEWIALTEAVVRINRDLPENEKLKVIIPETGFIGDSTGDPLQIPKHLNGRDVHIYNAIVKLLDNSKPTEKALAFFGGAHGSKKTRENYSANQSPRFTWITFSSMLAEKYKEKFASYNYIYLDSITNIKQLDVKFPYLSIAEAKYFINTNEFTRADRYDYTIIDSSSTSGVFYQYMQTKENIKYMYEQLKLLEEEKDKWINDETNFRATVKGQYLSYIYFLKLYCGDAFSYNFWNTTITLKSALSKLNINKFLANNTQLNTEISQNKINDLREYHNLMRDSGIEQFTYGAKMNTEKVITNMGIATKLLPEDIWSLFWLAYAQTEAKDYKNALNNWEVLFNNNLSSCLETLPYAYKKASICAENLKQIEKAKKFINIAKALKNEHNIDVDIYYKNLK